MTAPLVEKTILSTEPNTKTRKRACMALKALCDFAKLEYDPAPLAGNYGPSQVNPRDLPSDALILECYSLIQNPAWRWIYGVMATYGLRNHEAFRLDYERLAAGDRVVAILDNTKTGYHEAWAFYPEWFDEFDLQNVFLPNVDITRSNSSVGHSVTQYFKAVGIPFSPYNLRHAWAVRTLNFNLPYELAAMQQGHSAEVHKRTYHRWIKGDIHQRFYELITSRPDRPHPPAIERGLSSTDAQFEGRCTDS
ncbi:MAG: hypothetical protein KME20_13190 [Kaiparowitsia implicata GSE-PSE-MK54-09C]|nr:hypothetical protein [Kaiparowitsia implicata GSE-PSE-MK54-09C]